VTDLQTRVIETTARHRAEAERPWWMLPTVGQGRHTAADLCPTEDERRRSEVAERQRHRV